MTEGCTAFWVKNRGAMKLMSPVIPNFVPGHAYLTDWYPVIHHLGIMYILSLFNVLLYGSYDNLYPLKVLVIMT